MNRRRVFLVFALVVTSCVCVLIYLNLSAVSSIAAYAFIRKPNTKTILYWNSLFSEATFSLGEGYIASHCPLFSNCFATRSRFLQSIDSFDAIIFHGINGELNFNDVPNSRQAEQTYVFVALESPANRHISRQFDDFFNAMMTYHMDSDVIWTYADIVDLGEEQMLAVPSRSEFKWKTIDSDDDPKDIVEEQEYEKIIRMIATKRKLAIWYRSNCKTPGNREKYVAEFEEHAPLDKYGECSEDPGCPKDADCFKIHVEPNYFFYLSFENSLCDDYVSEKFYNALKYYVVPVVYGGANYSRFAPPNSYINALDFDTPKDLAKYLVYLSHNLTEYNKFFDWKKQYRVARPQPRIICDLCNLLNSDKPKSSYEISKWYGMNRCRLQQQLNRQIFSGGSYYATKETLNFH